MGSEGLNIIQRQIVDLTVNGEVNGIDLQRQADDLVKNDLMPKLSQLMDKYGHNRLIKIDKLEVNVADLQWDDFANNFSDRILAQVEKEFSRVVKSKPTDYPLTNDIEKADTTSQQQFVRLMIFTLQHGYLPWWSTVKMMSQWQDGFRELLESNVILAQNEIWELKIVLNNQFSFARLNSYLSIDNSIYWLFIKLFNNSERDTVTDIQDFFENVDKLYQSATVIPLLKQVLLRSIIANNNPNDVVKSFSDNAVDLLLKLNMPVKRGRDINERTQLPRNKTLQVALEELIKNIVIKKGKGENVKNTQASEINQNQTSITHKDPVTGLVNSEKMNEIMAKLKFSYEKNITDNQNNIEFISSVDSIYVNNAGLIILAPFLTAFFKKLNMVEDDKLTNKAKAITLLNYLTTGNAKFDEFDVVLNKIVSGEALDSFIEPTEITTEEKQEADDLLAAVIEHWSVLKNTSPDGLRGTFLQREGRLTFEDNKWSLKVQEQSFDMLLAHLPWGISVVKLPWMEHVLYVEWI